MIAQFSSKLSGLTIIMKPSFSKRGIHGEMIEFENATKIKFIDGMYFCKTEEEADFLRKYSAKNRSQVVEITKEDMEFKEIARAYHEKKLGKKPGTQGPIGATAPVKINQSPSAHPVPKDDPLVQVPGVGTVPPRARDL